MRGAEFDSSLDKIIPISLRRSSVPVRFFKIPRDWILQLPFERYNWLDLLALIGSASLV
jgi:hypothetical protein